MGRLLLLSLLSTIANFLKMDTPVFFNEVRPIEEDTLAERRWKVFWSNIWFGHFLMDLIHLDPLGVMDLHLK